MSPLSDAAPTPKTTTITVPPVAVMIGHHWTKPTTPPSKPPSKPPTATPTTTEGPVIF